MEEDRMLLVAAKMLLDIVFDSDDDEDDSDILEEVFYFRGPKPVRAEVYYESVIPRFTDKQFQSHFRVTRSVFQILENALSPLIKAKPNSCKRTVEERKQILMVLWIMANLESYRSIGDRFDIAKSTLWQCFYRVIRGLNMISTRFISWPNQNERIDITQSFLRGGRLPHVTGAVDSTYIPIKAPKENPEVYINRKCFSGISLQIIGTPTLKILDCFTGYPSSVSDIRIFRNSDFYKNAVRNHPDFFSDEEYIIGDKAYPVLIWCIPPYINRGEMTNSQRNFNTVHAKARQCVERTFALLYGRIRRLQHLDMNRFDLYAYVIKAGCVLHNICLLNREENLNQYIEEGIPVVRNNQDNEQVIENEVNEKAIADQGKIKRNLLARQLLLN